MRPALVIFDCDGVLVDSEPLAAQEFSAALHELGLPWDPATIDARFRGRRLSDCLTVVETALGGPLPGTFADELEDRTRRRFERDLVAVDGVREAIDQIRDALRLPVCVASSSAPGQIRSSLALTGLADCFGDALFSGTEVPNGKPAPDLFLHAARSMGAAPEACVVIEDSAAGVTGALAAHMEVLAYRAPPAASHPRRRDFDRMDALPGLLVAGTRRASAADC